MTDLDVLLAAVLADPADDTPRLVYADAIEERDGPGDAARADFIRVQVEWSQLARRQNCASSRAARFANGVAFDI